MKVGRNDPCPCGSGKKYKKCCIEKDQESAQVIPKPQDTRPSGEALQPRTDMPLDPHVEAINARWEAFDGLDYDGQIGLFTQTLDDEALMDSQMAFDMLLTIHEHSIKQCDHDRLDSLLDALIERLPEVYDHHAHYYLDWRITHALLAGRVDAIPALVNALAETAGSDIDTFDAVAERLAYHGQLSPLADAFRIAWPLVKSSDNIVPWAVDGFAERAGLYEIFDALEHGTPADSSHAALESRIGPYLKADTEYLSRFLGHLTGQTKKTWTPGEFDSTHQGGPDAGERYTQNLSDISSEFLGYLRREEGVPYTKGELARQQIRQYLQQRQDGKLEWRESPLEAAMRRGNHARQKQRRPPPTPPDHPLCPDPSTLDRYFGGLMNTFFPQRYKAATLMELMPAWLRFLESRQLIDARQREKSLQGLHELAGALLKVWQAYRDDPALQEGLQNSVVAVIQPNSC